MRTPSSSTVTIHRARWIVAVLVSLASGCANDVNSVGSVRASSVPSCARCDLGGLIDLARDRPVTASSVAAGSDAANVVDGEPESQWTSDRGGHGWIEVDLGRILRVKHVVLQWGDPAPFRFALFASADGRHYQRLLHGEVSTEEDALSCRVLARYVRVAVWRPPAHHVGHGWHRGAAHAGSSLRSLVVDGRENDPPSAPTDLYATAVGDDVVELRFDEATDDTDVLGYAVYRDGTRVGETCCGRFQDHGLAAGASHQYEVSTLDVFLNESSHSPPVMVTTEPTPRPLLVNGDFELGGSSPTGWTTGAYIPAVADFRYEAGQGRGGSRAVGVAHAISYPNDSWWLQQVPLVPGGTYNLYGWARGMDIAGGGVGANVAVYGAFVHSWERDSLGTFDWRPFVVTFQADASGLTPLQARLGFFASTVTGVAYFDDLTLPADTFASPPLSRHFDIVLERDDLTAVSTANLQCWANHMDSAYDAFADLTGDVPMSGDRVGILSVRQFPGGLAVAGNPIRWFQPYVQPDLQRIEDEDNWSFAMLHETSHLFDYDGRWAFQGEVTSNFKMIFVLDRLAARVRADGVLYEGRAIRDFFLMKYDEARAAGVLTWNAITHRLIAIVDTIGWLPFRETFRDFLALPVASVPTTPLAKLELFLDRLSANAGFEVRTLFVSDELTWMHDQLAP